MTTCPQCGGAILVGNRCTVCNPLLAATSEQAKTAALREEMTPACSELQHWKQRADAAESEVEARKRAWKEADAEFEQMKERAEKAESAAAEMRKVLERVRDVGMGSCHASIERSKLSQDQHNSCCMIHRALSTTCGQGFGHRETILHEAEELVKRQCAKFLEELPKQGWLSPDKAREEREEWVAVARLDAAVDVLKQIALHKIDTTDCADVTGTEEPIECVGEWAAQRIIDCMNAQESAEQEVAKLTLANTKKAQMIIDLREALETLMGEQNGPPLIRRKASWEAAMEKGRKALETVKNV